jgi:hypothetical protein
MDLSLYILSLKIAIVAYVYSDVLTEPGMVFNGLYQLLNRLPEWLFKPLIGCYKCVAGQMALWIYLFFCLTTPHSIEMVLYSIGNHIFFVSLTIFFTWMINKVYR